MFIILLGYFLMFESKTEGYFLYYCDISLHFFNLKADFIS